MRILQICNRLIAAASKQVLAHAAVKGYKIGNIYPLLAIWRHNLPKQSLTELDLKILDRLQKDGRMTNQQLSEEVGLSPSPCLRRVRLLEESGVITGYVALVEPDAVGLSVTAFVRIRLDQQDDAHLAVFEAALASLPEVMDCYLMTGEADYQLRVLVRSLGEFEDFLRHKLTRIKGVSQVTTSFALRPIVNRTALPGREAP